MTTYENDCYGMTEAEIIDQYMNNFTARVLGVEMVVMGVLSDAQELLAMGRADASRKQMNIAKFLLSKMLDSKRD